MSKLTMMHINIIGPSIAVVIALILWFGLIRPVNQETDVTKGQVSSTQGAGGTPEKVAAKKKELEKKKVEAAKTEADWAVNSRKYMPVLPYDATKQKPEDLLAVYESPKLKPNVAMGTGYGFKDIPTVWGRWMTAWYDAQRKYGITRQDTEFPIPARPADPNAISAVSFLAFPETGKPWPVKLKCKSFDVAMAHLQRFNGMQKHGMPVVNNVSLTGQSPDLLMNYDVSLYVIPTSAPPAPDTRTLQAGAGAAAGGPGGVPGMPGGAPGGGRPMPAAAVGAGGGGAGRKKGDE